MSLAAINLESPQGWWLQHETDLDVSVCFYQCPASLSAPITPVTSGETREMGL